MAKHKIWPLAALVVLGIALGLSPQTVLQAAPPSAQVTPIKPVSIAATRPTLTAAQPNQPVVVRTPTRVAASRPTPTVQVRPIPKGVTAVPTPKIEALYLPKARVEPLVKVVVRPLSTPSGVTRLPRITPLE